MRRLMDAVEGMEVITLHRVSDMARESIAALEAAVWLGCRGPFSGQTGSALEGAETLGNLVRRTAGRIDVMADCGVWKENIRSIHERSGVLAFHTMGRDAPLDSGMIYRKPSVSIGLLSLSEYELWRTDMREFEACAKIVHPLGLAH